MNRNINKSKYDLDGRPPLREAIPLGLQHIFAMFLSNIAVPIIIAGVVGITGDDLTLLVQSAMIMAGGSGAANFASAKNWLVGLMVMGIVIFLNRNAKGMAKTSSILIGIVIGYIVALPLNMVDFTLIKEASWFSIPRPFYFSMSFHWGAILPLGVMFIVTAIETVGDVTAITMGGAGREATDEEISGGVIANGITSSLGAIFNTLPNTSFSQNVGMISFTKIMSRYVVAVGSMFLILAGFIPKFGAVISTLPQSVIGGASIIIFSQIALTGIEILTSEPLNERSKIIIGLSLVFGLGLNQVPSAMEAFPEVVKLIFGESGIVIACVVATTLNIIIPEKT